MGKDTDIKTVAEAAPDGACEGGMPGPAILLSAPQLGENIGTTARAMANFGLHDLRLVSPRDAWPSDKARWAASGADHVIDGAKVFDTVAEAVGNLTFVAATTARRRDMVKPVLSPHALAQELRLRARRGESTGVLFGGERSGLDNDEISLCDVVVMAPVDPGFASLNLAQSVLLIAYEWFCAADPETLGRETPVDMAASEGLDLLGTRPATRGELVGFFEALEAALDENGFLYPPEKRPAMVRNIRNMFHRMQATEQDVRTLRGIVSSLTLHRKPRG